MAPQFSKEDVQKVFGKEPDKRTQEQIRLDEEIKSWADSRRARDQEATEKIKQSQKQTK